MKQILLHTAIIEWDSSETPSLFLHVDPEVVKYEVAKTLYANSHGDDTDDLPRFFDEFPHPPVRDPELLDWWLGEFRQATTVPWATFDAEWVSIPEEKLT